VTNLKQWVFGSFVSPQAQRIRDPADQQNSSFSACTTSPVIERKQKEPSLMQCLTTWVVRSVDEVSSSRLCVKGRTVNQEATESRRKTPARIRDTSCPVKNRSPSTPINSPHTYSTTSTNVPIAPIRLRPKSRHITD
jgi:hypothetical protein